MFKTKIKQKISILLALIASLAVWTSSTLVTNAKYEPQSRNLCALAIFPFDSTKPITYPAAINKLDNETCKKFLTYPNAYKNNPPTEIDNPLKAGAEGQNAPITEHDHAYFNDSVQDDYYYLSAVDKFEITLQSDGYSSIDLDKITCGTPLDPSYKEKDIEDIKDCEGNSVIWGGTTVTKKKIGGKAVITWDFAQTPVNGTYSKRPKVYGNNGNNFEGINLTDENNRKLPFYVKLTSKDNDKIWSATTTSRVLIVDMAIKKTNYEKNKSLSCVNNDVNDTKSGWCLLTPNSKFQTEQVFTTENKTFYWLPIGSVATVWREPTTPPQPNVCQSLTASLDPKTININGQTAYHIVVNKPTFTPKNEIPADAKLKLTSTDDSKGEFWILSPMAGLEEMASPYVKIGTGTATTFPTNTKIYYIGTKPTKVKVELTNIPVSQLGTTCYGYVFIPIEEKECKNILIDHPKKIYEGTVSVFKSNALDTDYKDFPGKIKYWVDAGYGEFYVMKPKNIPDNPSEYVYEATPTSATVPVPDYKIDPGIIIAGNTPETAIGAVVNIATALATGTFGIETLSANLPNQTQIQDFAFKNLIEVPSWMETGLKPNINPIDPTPTATGGSFFNPNFGMNSLLALNFGNFDIQPAINPDFTIEDLTPDTAIDTPYYITSLFESVTVDPGTTVYFWAKKTGKNVVHVKTINSNVKECRRDFDIEPKPQLLCKELNVVTNTKGDLVTGQPALVNINPKDTANIKLPPTTKFKISTTTDGKFQNVAGNNLGNTALLTDFPIYLKNATTAGTVTVKIDNTDPAYAAICAAEVKVKVSQNQCTALSYTLVKYGDPNGTNQTTLDKGMMYKVLASLSTTSTSGNTITYSIDNQYGIFIKADDIPMQMAIKYFLSNLNTISFDTLAQPPFVNSLAYQLTVPENSTVILVTFSNPPASPLTKDNALTIQGTGYSDPCIKYVTFVQSEQPKECKDDITSITTPDSIPFNPNMTDSSNPPNYEVVFNINNPADYQDFLNQSNSNKIKVTLGYTGSASNPPAITYMNGTPSLNGTLTFTKTGPFAFKYFKNGYNELNDKLTLTVDATTNDNLVPTCHLLIEKNPPTTTKECKSLSIDTPDSSDLDDWEDANGKIKIDVDAPGYNETYLWYHWEVTDGKWEDTTSKKIIEQKTLSQTLENFEEDTKVKVWASEKEDSPQLGNCSDTITAKAEKPDEKKEPKIEKFAYKGPISNYDGSGEDILNINSNTNNITFVIKFTPNDDIETAELQDSKLNAGRLNNNGSTTDGYLELNRVQISLLLPKNNDEQVIFDSQNYKKYEENGCNSNKNKDICFENDAEDIKEDFGNGKRIVFDNLQKKKDYKILIKYQMSYEEKLTDILCQGLKGACGEQFKNKAEFEAKSLSSNKIYEDSATAKVIAICPYILTRQGGDVFFHDVIDTGVDVAQCSEVKSCDGPCITPEPPTKQKQIKTGAGDIAEDFIKLDLPSHDVCRYSNVGSNLEGYNNVLKNFSSTICELRADVSKAWTKKNINDSIAANVKRIARWEGNLENSSYSDTSQLNSTSGVFVRKNGDLTIGSLSDYVINKNESVPAAQTYIVIGHDLYINSNIKYASLGLEGYNKTKNIPSAAFIVIDGDIIIDSSVKQIDGILMAVDLNGDDQDGKVKANGYTNDNTLTINGNLIGDVNDLFKNRQAVGDPRKDEGSVTIRYDERILLNTPPGINELINVQQAIVP